MQHIDLMEKLSEKIDALLQRCEGLKKENEQLRRELVTCKAASEEKDKEIQKLQDELAMKNLEIDEIIKKIESFVG
ncbi:MAG: hypothetical protein C6H99_01190 [Epsilonproteobacteria bacterium]|nr:hypothetical protein [Campylobacterota bacterium]NPA63587.1 hypothetical protein [Campylobacterota bacterium]